MNLKALTLLITMMSATALLAQEVQTCESGDPLCGVFELPKKEEVSKNKVAKSAVKKKKIDSKKAAVERTPAKIYLQQKVETKEEDKSVKKTSYGWDLNFDDANINADGFNYLDVMKLRRPKSITMMDDKLECQLPKEVTDQYGFDRLRCRALGIYDESDTYYCRLDFFERENAKLKLLGTKKFGGSVTASGGNLMYYQLESGSKKVDTLNFYGRFSTHKLGTLELFGKRTIFKWGKGYIYEKEFGKAINIEGEGESKISYDKYQLQVRCRYNLNDLQRPNNLPSKKSSSKVASVETVIDEDRFISEVASQFHDDGFAEVIDSEVVSQ